MGCMKCGRDLSEDRVFCESCLEQMERYPVKMNTPVQLPSRRDGEPVARRPVRRKLSVEEQLRRVRKRNRTLSFLLALALMAAIFFGYISCVHFLEEKPFRPGQNYSSVETLPG